MPSASRNNALYFADLTRKNLEFLERARDDATEEVHVVTQLVLSLLGIIVFPWERNFVHDAGRLKLRELEQTGWPHWDIQKGRSKTLGDLLRHLRNAIAHGRIQFSSDSRRLEAVDITVEDQKEGAPEPHWRAQIRASELRRFCARFVELVDNAIG